MSLFRSRKLANLTRDFHTLFVIYVSIKTEILDQIAQGKYSKAKIGTNFPNIVDSVLESGASVGLWSRGTKNITPYGREFAREDPNGFRAWVIGLVELQAKMLTLVPNLMGGEDGKTTPFIYENKELEEMGIASAAQGMARFMGFRCLDRIKELEKGNCRVLDVGCGYGEYLLYLANRNQSLEGVGIDLSIAVAKVAKERVNEYDPSTRRLTIVNGDFLKSVQNFEKNSFDAILLNFLLHYFTKANRIELLSHCASLLKKKGVIVILEPVLRDHDDKQRVEFAAFNLNLFPQEATFHGLPRISELKNAIDSSGLVIRNEIKPFPLGPIFCYVVVKNKATS